MIEDKMGKYLIEKDFKKLAADASSERKERGKKDGIRVAECCGNCGYLDKGYECMYWDQMSAPTNTCGHFDRR